MKIYANEVIFDRKDQPTSVQSSPNGTHQSETLQLKSLSVQKKRPNLRNKKERTGHPGFEYSPSPTWVIETCILDSVFHSGLLTANFELEAQRIFCDFASLT